MFQLHSSISSKIGQSLFVFSFHFTHLTYPISQPRIIALLDFFGFVDRYVNFNYNNTVIDDVDLTWAIAWSSRRALEFPQLIFGSLHWSLCHHRHRSAQIEEIKLISIWKSHFFFFSFFLSTVKVSHSTHYMRNYLIFFSCVQLYDLYHFNTLSLARSYMQVKLQVHEELSSRRFRWTKTSFL